MALDIAMAFCGACVFTAPAATNTWSGGVVGSWTVPGNWSLSAVPTISDNVLVGSSSAVTNASSSTYATLTVESGASVSMAGGDIGIGSRTLTVNGTLTRDSSGVVRLNGATLNLAGHVGSNFSFLDTNGGTINFKDGAAFDNTNMGFEHKGNNTFSFKLSAGGFKTVKAGQLYSGNNGQFTATWSNVTYNVDISDYDLRCGLRIVLMDFSGNGLGSNFSAAKVNIIAGSSGLLANLTFDTAAADLVLTFPYPLTWTGDNGSNWLDKLNWMPTNLPTVSDTVLVKSGGSVTNGQCAFNTLEILTNATVKLSSATGQSGLGSRTVSVAGTLGMDSGGVLRLSGATINLSGHLGSGITWLDMGGGTINFTNGCAFDNPNMSFEHKGWNTFRYTLSTNGFTKLVAGKLWSGNNAAWSNATYTINVSPYTGPRPAEIVLADYNGHDNIFTNTFNPTVVITGNNGGKLRFDKATSSLVLHVYGPRGTLISVR